MTRTPLACRAIAAIALGATAAFPTAGLAQEPSIVGRVTAFGGLPVAGMEVSIDGTKLKAATDADGRFSIAGAQSGAQDVVASGPGYLPARIAVRVPDVTGTVHLTVLPETPQMAAVVDQGKAHLLAGVIVNAASEPVAGATIDVVGATRQTVTSDDSGRFVLPAVRNGIAVYRVRKDGYFATHGAVRMFDRRGFVVMLQPLDAGMNGVRRATASNLNNNDEAAWRDAAQRIASRRARAVIMGAVDLAPFAERPLREALRQTKAGNAIMPEIENALTRICVLANGNHAVGSTSLDTWLAHDVELVELYPPGTESSETSTKYLANAGCLGDRDPSGRVQAPFIAVVWLR